MTDEELLATIDNLDDENREILFDMIAKMLNEQEMTGNGPA